MVELLPYPRASYAKCVDPSRENEAMLHLRAGNDLLDQDAFEPALREYRQAYALCKSDMLLFSFASCEAELGMPAAAAEHFDRFLREMPVAEPALRTEATRALKALAHELLVVELRGAPVDATIVIDGSLSERPRSLPFYLMPGTHTLRVRSNAANVPFEQTIGGAPGTHLLVDVPMFVLADPAAPPTRLVRRWWFWAAVGTALAAGAVAAYSLSRPDRPPCDPPLRCP
jgi:tetratricopeptide (TPR) repeat protein